jgi:hypothetical protein
MDRWEPLRAALAWLITDGDEDFVTWVGNASEFNEPSILVRGLSREMYQAGCFVSLPQTHGQLALAEGYSGRFLKLAEGFETDRRADLNNGILCLDRYLLRCVNEAVRQVCHAIRERKFSAEGIAIVDGIERGIERLPPDAITEATSLRKLRQDTVLCPGLTVDGRCWKSVCVSWTGFLKCFSTKATIRAEKDCERWLQQLMETSPKKRLQEKRNLLPVARARFPGLSERAFERAWLVAAKTAGADAWIKGGAPPGARKSPQ